MPCSTAGELRRARPCSCSARRAASASPRSSSARRSARASIAAVSSEEKAEAAGRPAPMRRVVYPRGPFDKDGPKALAQLFKDAVGPGGADVDLRSGRRRLYRGRAAQHRLGGAVSRRRLPGRHPEAAAQPHPAQELRRVRRLLGRVRGARSQGQCRACRDSCSAGGRRAGSRRRSARTWPLERGGEAIATCSATARRSASWW